MDRQKDRYIDRKINRQIERQIDRQKDRQMDKILVLAEYVKTGFFCSRDIKNYSFQLFKQTSREIIQRGDILS